MAKDNKDSWTIGRRTMDRRVRGGVRDNELGVNGPKKGKSTKELSYFSLQVHTQADSGGEIPVGAQWRNENCQLLHITRCGSKATRLAHVTFRQPHHVMSDRLSSCLIAPAWAIIDHHAAHHAAQDSKMSGLWASVKQLACVSHYVTRASRVTLT